MDFGKDKTYIKIGEKVGFVVAYLVFVVVLSLIFTLMGKIFSSLDYLYVLAGVFIVMVFGFLLKRWLS